MAECPLPKPNTRVRFPSSAPNTKGHHFRGALWYFDRITESEPRLSIGEAIRAIPPNDRSPPHENARLGSDSRHSKDGGHHFRGALWYLDRITESEPRLSNGEAIRAIPPHWRLPPHENARLGSDSRHPRFRGFALWAEISWKFLHFRNFYLSNLTSIAFCSILVTKRREFSSPDQFVRLSSCEEVVAASSFTDKRYINVVQVLFASVSSASWEMDFFEIFTSIPCRSAPLLSRSPLPSRPDRSRRSTSP